MKMTIRFRLNPSSAGLADDDPFSLPGEKRSMVAFSIPEAVGN
ncbi:hypothetical protein [Geothermobacter hydrogeniphilus]|nr:hypothetical protein [Geothermobacter hydrogeniphilus]